jgi:streptogramin lyase
VQAQLNLPMAVAIGADGGLYICDAANSRIRRIGPDGVIQTVTGFGGGEGLGGAGYVGDGGPAEKAKLFSPTDVKADAAGNLFISDGGNNRIRILRPAPGGGAGRVIETFAGTGNAGARGDGGAATAAELNTPQKIALASDGSVYIADRANGRIRKIDARGVITTIAGGDRPTGPAATLLAPEVLKRTN